MHMKHLIVVAGAVMLAASGACNAPPSEPVEAAHVEMPEPGAIAPEQAISAAAAEPAAGVEGTFEFRVASVGGGRGRVFLNSEADYHDAGNLSVMLPAKAAKEMEKALGAPLSKALVAKQVSVTGTARQVTVNVYGPDRKKTGETHTQTRIEVASADRIVVK